jgi:hypothetical protein
MGHERLGVLPKSRKWRQLIDDLGKPGLSSKDTAIIASRTLENVRKRYEKIADDHGVQAALKFLVAFSVYSNKDHPRKALEEIGINIPHEPTPLSVTKAAHIWIEKNQSFPEYARLAQYATGDALMIWYDEQKESKQPDLFIKNGTTTYKIWSKASSGSGFCELSRLFFAKLTERYLKFFLEREATAAISDLNNRDTFQSNLSNHIDSISKHAFESSKITQSFAAGWFNKHAKDKLPTNEALKIFLSYSFEKMREELYREENGEASIS